MEPAQAPLENTKPVVTIYESSGSVDHSQIIKRYDIIRRMNESNAIRLPGTRQSCRLVVSTEGLPASEQLVIYSNYIFLMQIAIYYRGGSEIKFREWDTKDKKFVVKNTITRDDYLEAFEKAGEKREKDYDFPAVVRADTFKNLETAGKIKDHQKLSSTYKTSCFLDVANDTKGEGVEKLCPVIVFVPNPGVQGLNNFNDIPFAFAAFEFDKTVSTQGTTFKSDCYYPYYLTNYSQYTTFKLINPLGHKMSQAYFIATECGFAEDDFGFDFNKFRSAEEIAKYMPVQFPAKFTNDIVELYDVYAQAAMAKPQMRALFHEKGLLKFYMENYFAIVEYHKGTFRNRKNLFEKAEGDIEAELDFEPVKLGEKRAHEEEEKEMIIPKRPKTQDQE